MKIAFPRSGLFLSCLLACQLFAIGCDSGVDSLNPYDPRTPPDKQARASLSGVIQGSPDQDVDPVNLQGATVELRGPPDPANNPITTGDDGAFGYSDLIPGNYTLEVTHPQYVAQVRFYYLSPGADVEDNLVLRENDATGDTTGRLTGQARLQAQMSRPEPEQDHSGILVEVEDTGVRTVTNREGWFDLFLNGGSYNLLFSATDHLPTRADDVLVVANQDNNLPNSPVVLAANPGTVRGVVLLESLASGALDGTTVSLPGGGTTLTGPDGGFVLTDVPAGIHTLTATRTGFVTGAQSGVVVRGGQETLLPELALNLARGSIRGVVQKAQSGSHSGISVELSNTPHAVLTNSQGEFLLADIPVGTYELRARHDGYLRGSASSVPVQADQETQLDPLLLSVWEVGFSINSGAAYTNGPTVTLTLTAEQADSMRISEDPGFAGANFQAFATPHQLDLSTADGLKTLFVQFRTLDGILSGELSHSILLDGHPPQNVLVLIDGDSVYTTDPAGQVTLTLFASDAASSVANMRISNDGNFDDVPLEPFLEHKSHVLDNPMVGGEKTVWVMFYDSAGNGTQIAASDSTTLDSNPPLVNQFSLNGGTSNEPTNDTSLQVHLDLTDDVSGEVVVALAETSISCQSATYQYPPSGTHNLELSPGDGIRSMYLCARDAAGNHTPNAIPASNSVLLDTQGPEIPSLTRTSITDAEVGLAWTEPAGAVSYVLQRRLVVEGAFRPIATPGVGTTSFLDPVDPGNPGTAALLPDVCPGLGGQLVGILHRPGRGGTHHRAQHALPAR